MELEKKIHILQAMYAGALADSVLRMGQEGILEKVTQAKRMEQMQVGRMRAAQLGITCPQEVFKVLSDVFGCANWSITDLDHGFKAVATSCMLCSLAKKLGAQSPCNIYCLDPMEAMVKGTNSSASVSIQETLWQENACKIEIGISEKQI